MTRVSWGVLLAGCMAPLPSPADEATVAAGKQRALASPVEWEVREGPHPALGPVRFAFNKKYIVTPAGSASVYSRAFISCEHYTKRIAIELVNMAAPDDPGGLRPRDMPVLACNRLDAPGEAKTIREELLSPRWEVGKAGDALTRGLTVFSLRECAWIDVVQEVELPEGSAQRSLAVTFEIPPYNRELDSVFAACGDPSAYTRLSVVIAPVPASAPAPAPALSPVPEPVATPAPVVAEWQSARVVSNGKTNVRAGPNIKAALVMQLHPGMPVQAQQADGDWWRVRTSVGGKRIEGFIREDRLVFK